MKLDCTITIIFKLSSFCILKECAHFALYSIYRVANSANKLGKNQNNKKSEIEKDNSMSPEILPEMPSTSKKKTKRKQKTKASMADPKLMNKKYNLIPQHSPLHPSPSRTSPSEKNQLVNNDYKSPRYVDRMR